MTRSVKEGLRFFENAGAFLRDCKRPVDQDFEKVVLVTLIGFLAIGFMGYAVKLVHIPITQILVGN